MIVLYILGYFCRNKQNSYAALNLVDLDIENIFIVLVIDSSIMS